MSVPTKTSRRTRRFAVGAVLALAAGCHTPPAQDRASVASNVEARFAPAAPAPRPAPPGQVLVPDGLADGRPLTEEQAVILALWNNAAFLEALVELDLTRADLVQA